YDHSGKLDHLVLYRPGTGIVWVVKHNADGTYAPLGRSSTGIGGYDLKSAADRIVPFDYDHSGKLDHLVLYPPGSGLRLIVEHDAGAAFSAVYFNRRTGIGGYDLPDAPDQLLSFHYEHSGRLDHLVLYRPGTGTVFIVQHGTGNTFIPLLRSVTGAGGYDMK